MARFEIGAIGAGTSRPTDGNPMLVVWTAGRMVVHDELSVEIARLERGNVLAPEEMARSGEPKHTSEALSEHAGRFLANPWQAGQHLTGMHWMAVA